MQTKPPTNKGISTGIVIVVLLLLIHILVDVLNNGNSRADFFLWFIQVLLYFFGGLIAASSQFIAQHDLPDPTEGIANASRGSALIVFAVMWCYFVIRSIAIDDAGMFAGMGLVFSIFFGMADLVIALVLGSISGSIIRKKNELYQ
ncbi:MAG: hypothetical protein VB013_08185 [Anaerolineaceae bacterium]|nr:hypothetical protein [Anaerolineaceae bacterium]